MAVPELLDGPQVLADRADVGAALGLREHDADAHGPSIGCRAYRRVVGPEEQIRREAKDVYSWSNGTGDRYAEHEHGFTKLLYCTRGSIDFRTPEPHHQPERRRPHGAARGHAPLRGR